jgi:stage III sporulation protein AA
MLVQVGGENMRYQMLFDKRLDDVLSYTLKRLPSWIGTSIVELICKRKLTSINEIRLHSNSFLCLIADSKNIKTDIILTQDDINEIINLLCEGSLYAHFDTIKEGYISIGKGIRAGICGRASIENGKISAINDITSINIRLPKRIFNGADYLFNLLKESEFSKSVILYSRPGVGKTSILRELIYKISSEDPPPRHAVIDSREEITPFMKSEEISSDIFISYPKGLAIEIATKSMTPELIICDEISSESEATAILKSSNSGVKIIATAHADSFEELCSKEILKELFSHKVFDFALGISRKYGSKKYEFTLDTLCEAKK